MSVFRASTIALSALCILPACSLIIDTNPDGVILESTSGGSSGHGGSGPSDRAGRSSGGTSNQSGGTVNQAGASASSTGGSPLGGVAGTNTATLNAGGATPLGGTTGLSGASGAPGTGAAVSTGGIGSVQGGSPSIGGSVGSAGSTSVGGVAQGGAPSSSGAAGSGVTSSGGSSSVGGTADTGGQASVAGTSGISGPTITNFYVDSASTCSGKAVTITATFANGTGTVDQGVGTVTSGTAKTTAVLTAPSTTFTLTVGNGTQTATKTITVTTIGSGSFLRTGTMIGARFGHTATMLTDGRVLMAGGSNNGALNTAELYDVSTGTFKSTVGPMLVPRAAHTAAPLPNGKVLLAGGGNEAHGMNVDATSSLASAEIYDPNETVAAFQGTGSMAESRCAHTATLLPNGRVLVAGGINPATGATLLNAEIFDYLQGNGEFVAGGALKAERYWHTATLLANGKVLLAGGHWFEPPDTESFIYTNEVYDPTTFTFANTGAFVTGVRDRFASVLLSNNKVLFAGGTWSWGGMDTIAHSEVFDPASGLNGNFNATTSMSSTRAWHTATLLPNGKALIVGGYSASGFPSSGAELFDIGSGANGAFAATGFMTSPRAGHTATLLKNGMVLIAGGRSSTVALPYAELYCP